MSLHSSSSSSNRSFTSSARRRRAAAADLFAAEQREQEAAERAAAAARAQRLAAAELAAARVAEEVAAAAAAARAAAAEVAALRAEEADAGAAAAAALRRGCGRDDFDSDASEEEVYGVRADAGARTEADRRGFAGADRERGFGGRGAGDRGARDADLSGHGLDGAPGGRNPWRDPRVDRTLEAQQLREEAARLEAEQAFGEQEARARHGRGFDYREPGGRDAGAHSPRRRRASPSPDRRRGHRGRPGSPPAMQTVFKDVGAVGGWPMLTKTNYAEWSMVMKVKMQARRMWDAVRYGDADFDEDRRALEALLAAVPTEMHSSLANKRTAKDAWDAIAAARIGSDRARRSTLQKLRQEWENLAFKPGEDVDDFALRLNTLMQQLARYGDDDIDEERSVEKFLRVVPKKYSQVAIAIETLLDFSELSIEEVTGRLKAVDNREQLPPSEPVTIGGKLLFTEEQWLARQRERKKGEASGSSASDPLSSRKRRPRKQDKARGGAPGGADSERKATHDDTCNNCGRTGHWAKDCRQAKRGGQAHVAQAQEGDEAALFFVHGSIEPHSPPAPAATALLHLDEPLLPPRSFTDFVSIPEASAIVAHVPGIDYQGCYMY